MSEAVTKAVLALDGVTVKRSGKTVVMDLSLDIGGGEFVCVVGANGAGKSTLLKAIAGLLPLEGGTIKLDGAPLSTFAPRDLARRIAYLPQDRIVHWPLAAERVVALGRIPHRAFAAGESDGDRAAIVAAMTRMDVTQFAQRPIATLSGGEQARVLISRALAQSAGVIIADEPTAGLDPRHALTVFDEFRQLTRSGTTIVTALHDLSLAARYATRVIVMSCGKCIANGPPAQVLCSDVLREAFDVDARIVQVDGVPLILILIASRPT